MTLIHLVFTLFKIAIQASIYATLLFLLARVYEHITGSNNTLVRSSRNSKQFWWRSWRILSVALSVFSLTYWGNHGFGDLARIPLGYDRAMEQSDGTITHFEPVTKDLNNEIEAYQVSQKVVCARTGSNTYFAYDLISKKYQRFSDSSAYNAYAVTRGLPRSDEFESFAKHYARYWNGWRFWLLA